jgi:maltooligosyltrehalose trehalohydrolase
MSPIRVWAPRAREVDLVRGDGSEAMQPIGDGWWQGPVLPPETDYGFRVDGGEVRADPRARWLPNGPHGLARTIDLEPVGTPFRARPLDDAVIYELHLGTFTPGGTFASAIERLAYLVELGVTHVEVMPIAQFAGKHGWGYDGVNPYSIHAEYGGPRGFLAFVQACHARGLAVIVDVVHNHLGPEGSYLDELGPYHTRTHRTPWGDALNFDAARSHEVRRYFIDSALALLRDFDVDGLRLDAVHAIVDDSPTHLVAELAHAVLNLSTETGRQRVLIGEYDHHDPKIVQPRTAGGWGLDAHWNDDFHHALHVALTGETAGYYGDFAGPDVLQRVLANGYHLDGGYSQFRGAAHGKPFGDVSRDRLVAYTQSHDQIGNRIAGERLVALVGNERAKLAAALLFVAPFVPMLFQGEEWGATTPFQYFCDFEDPELRRAIRDGRRREHGGHDVADPFDPQTREACVLRWTELSEPDHRELFAWYRAWIELRHEHRELRDPAPGSLAVRSEQGGLVIERGPFALVANLGDHDIAWPVGEVVIASQPPTAVLAPWACVLVRR